MVTIRRVGKNQTDVLIDRNLTDVLKFIACLAVAMSHYSGYVVANGISSSFFYKVLAANGGYIGVAFFFFLSGYGLMKSDMKHHLSFYQYFKRRLLKTYLPAVLVSALWLGVAAFTSFDLLCNQHYFLGVVWRFNDEVLWFVNSILIMYIAFGLYCAIKQYLDKNAWILLFFFAVASYGFLHHFNIGSTMSVPLFFIGVLTAQYGGAIRHCFQNTYVGIAFILIAIISLILFRHDNYLLHGWINYISISVFIWALCRWNIIVSKVPKWLGPFSYDVYLVHNKVHLSILYFIGIDSLGLFLPLTAILSIGVYQLHKHISF